MSKAFTSEETADEAVLGRVVTRVPRGAERPMTPEGYKALLAEKEALLTARVGLRDEARTAADHRLALVQATLESVRVVEPVPADGVVRFGSTVTLQWNDGRVQALRLVGPDEADGKDGRVSIESPLARTLLEQRAGDEVEVERPRGVATARLLSVT